jgi:hypothetical protein
VKIIVAIVLCACLAGCNTGPKAAETEVKPGKAEASSTRREVRPRSSETKIVVDRAPEPTAVRIIVTPGVKP